MEIIDNNQNFRQELKFQTKRNYKKNSEILNKNRNF